VIEDQSLAKGVLRLSQSLRQTLGQTRPADSAGAAQIELAFGVDMAVATPVTDGAVATLAAATTGMAVFVPLVMVIILLPGPLQTPG
jgi:hypothetical protein